MTDLQFRILDTLYFVEPFENILEEVGEPENIVTNGLRELLALRWVQAMVYDPKSQDYVPSTVYDVDHLRDYRYVATRQGLLKHSGR